MVAWCLLLLCNKGVLAQDYTFSQFYEQPMLRNPALAGIFTGDIRVSLAHRDQWGSVTVPYRTTSLSVEYKLPVGTKDDILALGTQMSMDGAGDLRLRRTQIMPVVNFHKSLSENNDTYLSAAFMGGPVSSQFDPSQMKMGDQYRGGSFDPSIPTSQPITATGYSYWDMAAGLSFSSTFNNKTRFYLAAGLSHFTNPTITSVTGNAESFLKPRWSFNLGVNCPSGDKGHLIAFVDYFVQNGNRQFLGGALYGVNIREYDNNEPDVLYVGSFMRWGDAAIPTIKMEFAHFSIGVSYDVNISKLKVASNLRGGLELTASYRDFLKIRSSTLDKVRCVRF
jgi:type IX secretion system PorP/SprF family membrane protein